MNMEMDNVFDSPINMKMHNELISRMNIVNVNAFMEMMKNIRRKLICES